MTIEEGFAGHGSHRPGMVCLECDRTMTAQPGQDPVMELLAEALHEAFPHDDPYGNDAWCHGEAIELTAGTEPGTRLLAALRDGLAWERVTDAIAWSVDATAGGIAIWNSQGLEGSGATLHAAVSAALDEPTGAAQEEER